MRILFCTDTYPPQVNGVSVVTALSAAGLTERGWECSVVAPRYPRALERRSADLRKKIPVTGVPSVPLPRYPEIRVALPGTVVADAIERARPDIVHCATEFIIGRAGLRAAARRGIPVCTSYHTDFTKYMRSYGVPWLAGVATRSVTNFHRRSERVFTPSRYAADGLATSGLADIEVWGRGVDDVLFDPARRSAVLRRALGLGDAFTFLFVGRLAPEKEVDVVLDAFARVEAAMPTASVRLLVAGAGPSMDSLKRRASPAVTFLGSLDRETQLPALYASADAFVMASTTETLGLVALEAMASGAPVIASAIGGVADYLRDGENGLSFAPRDAAACAGAMLRLCRDEALRMRLGRGARKTAQSRSWEQELDRLDASYREVLERRRGAASGLSQRPPAA